MKPRDELIAIQKRLISELKQRIDDTFESPDPKFRHYRSEYEAEFDKGYERIASREEIVDQLSRANVAYFGDYHTLRTAQSAVLSVLRELVKARKKPLVLGLEMLHAQHTAVANNLISGRIGPQEFRKAVRWKKYWGFPWQSYGRFFDFARNFNVPLFGLNINADEMPNSLAWRDDFAAELVSSLTLLYPDRLVAVVYGDMHVAQNHMPKLVEEKLAHFGLKKRQLLVFQNSEDLYWKLVDRRLEHVVDILKVRRDAYCIMNATPLVKYQSFLNWEENSADLAFAGLEDLDPSLPGESTLLEEVVEFVRNIAAFLKVEIKDPAGFELATAADFDVLENLIERKIYSESEMAALKTYMQVAETAYFSRANILFLGNLSVSHAAEAAMKYVLACLRPTRTTKVEPRDDFYARIMLEALAFFGSKIINPRRKPRTLDEWKAIEEELKGERNLSEPQKIDREVARGYIEHVLYEEKVLEGGPESRTRALFAHEPPVHVALTRAIGRTLGDRLFLAVAEERIDRALIVQAIKDDPFKADVARERYFDLLGSTDPKYATKERRWTRHDDEEE